jgi:hypothetical protein
MRVRLAMLVGVVGLALACGRSGLLPADGIVSPTPSGTTPTPTPTLFDTGDGHDGVLTVSDTESIGTCQPVVSGSGASIAVTGTAPGAGTMILVIQMQDDVANTGDQTPATAPGAAGNWELARVAPGSTGSTIVASKALVHVYGSGGTRRAQLCTVPQYSSASISGTIQPESDWDGASGGVVAMVVNGNVDLSGTISADKAGFRGGQTDGSSTTANTNLDTIQADGGGKGEGFDGRANTRFGRGNYGNGGGAGNAYNAGGAGGGNGGAGGAGGLDRSATTLTGGLPGVALQFTAGTRLLFGGGGGGGHQNDGQGGSGASGGGLVFVIAKTFSAPTGTISANGDKGETSQDGTNADGAGGGGAGGTIYLIAADGGGTLGTLSAAGGDGGDVDQPSGNPARGAGGGGGGGAAWVHGVTVTTPALAPGANGVNVNQGNDPNGAAPGILGALQNL